jgi:hypothetical protein
MGAFAPASIEYRSAEAALDVSVSELRAHRLVSPGAQVADDLREAANLQRSLGRERIRRSGRATPIKRSDFASVRRQIFSDTWIVFLESVLASDQSPQPGPPPERDISEMENYVKSMARREGFDGSLRSLVESASRSGRTGARGGIRGRASLAMRFVSEAGSRRRIPTRGRSMTYTLTTGI